jgi:hypothetical protein
VADKTILILGGLGVLYYLYSQQQSAKLLQPYPGTAPANPNKIGGGGGSGGSGAGGGSSSGSGKGGGSGTTQAQGSGPAVVQGPQDPCDFNGPAYNSQTCSQYGGSVYGDPCNYLDPAYNQAQCEDNGGAVYNNYQDTQDPCDPNSSMYDPNQCGSAVVAVSSGPDSGDPCDPSSSAYNMDICSATQYPPNGGYL